MKRVLFLVSSMGGGGAERVAALLCNHWAEQGHEVTLMPTFSGRGECVYPLDERVRLDYLADRMGRRSRAGMNRVRRGITLRRFIREMAPDVIVSFLSHVNVAAVVASWRLRVPVVVSERTHPPARGQGWVLEMLRRFTYGRTASVVVQTQRTLNWLGRCCSRANGRVIPNPVVYPLPRGEPVQEPGSVLRSPRRLVLAVGRLHKDKGFDEVVSAFGTLAKRYPNWELVILGEGSERERLEQQRINLGLTGRVHLPGRVGNPGDWYLRADFYVMSSRYEGFPNTLLEAMAHGLPAVSFDCETGPADIVREGVDGYLVPPAEGAAGLARAMEAVLQHDDERHRLGQAAMAVRERFSSERIMKDWDDLLALRDAEADR